MHEYETPQELYEDQLSQAQQREKLTTRWLEHNPVLSKADMMFEALRRHKLYGRELPVGMGRIGL